jgi:hypothetical protein
MIENDIQCDDPHLVETFHQFDKKKLLILGHGRHGKDTVAELIAEKFGLTFNSSSRAALDAIWPALDVATEYKYYDKEEAFSDRSNCRELWKELITLYNTPDKASLCKLILSQCDMYVGMRCDLEYEASRELFDHVIWVDASDRYPKEPSMKIKCDHQSMIWVDNNGTLDDLTNEVQYLEGIFEKWDPHSSYSV